LNINFVLNKMDAVASGAHLPKQEEVSVIENEIYHEKQVRQLCAVHAINNLLQKCCFKQKDLDNICYRLTPDALINPHKSILGTGNYDVNVLMSALQDKGLETVWFDKRKPVDGIKVDQVVGFILNIPNRLNLGLWTMHRKHWLAVRRINHKFVNLDSKLKQPCVIGSEEQLLNFLKAHLHDTDKELLIAVEPEVYRDSTWYGESDAKSSIETAQDKERETVGGVDQSGLFSKDETDRDVQCQSENECTR